MKKILMFLMLSIVLVACGGDEFEKTEEEPLQEEVTSEEVEVVAEELEESTDEPEIEEDSVWDELKELDKIVGKSDKDFSELTKSKPHKVRNDNTGNWRITKISESIPIEEYALSYFNTHMNEGEIHFIVNFNYNTTTWLNEVGGLLYVEVREYVNKEEHDASQLGSGLLLKSYVIYPDGDIQELES